MSEEDKKYDEITDNATDEQAPQLPTQSFTLVLPCIDDTITVGWSVSNNKFQSYLMEGGFEESIQDLQKVMEGTV